MYMYMYMHVCMIWIVFLQIWSLPFDPSQHKPDPAELQVHIISVGFQAVGQYHLMFIKLVLDCNAEVQYNRECLAIEAY